MNLVNTSMLPAHIANNPEAVAYVEAEAAKWLEDRPLPGRRLPTWRPAGYDPHQNPRVGDGGGLRRLPSCHPAGYNPHQNPLRVTCERCPGFDGFALYFAEYRSGHVPRFGPNRWLVGDRLVPITIEDSHSLSGAWFESGGPILPAGMYAKYDDDEIPEPVLLSFYFDDVVIERAANDGTLRGKYAARCPSCKGGKLDLHQEKLEPVLTKLFEAGHKSISLQRLAKHFGGR